MEIEGERSGRREGHHRKRKHSERRDESREHHRERSRRRRSSRRSRHVFSSPPRPHPRSSSSSERSFDSLSYSSSSSRSPSPQRKRHKSHHGKSHGLPDHCKPISKDDYYRLSAEYALWLKEVKHKRFDDLKSRKQQKYFKDFIKQWNRGRLDERYYNGLDPNQLPHEYRTGYKWKFFSDVDLPQRSAPLVASSGSAQRSVQHDEDDGDVVGPTPLPQADDGPKPIGPALPPGGVMDEQELREREREQAKYEYKKHRRTEREKLDELAPKPSDPREARMEKSKARAADRRARENDDGLETVNEYDSGGSSFKALLDRQMAFKQRREAEQRALREEKIAHHREKEDKTMSMLRELAAAKGFL